MPLEKIFKRKGDEIVGASKFKRLNKKVIAARKMEGIISLFVYIVIIVHRYIVRSHSIGPNGLSLLQRV